LCLCVVDLTLDDFKNISITCRPQRWHQGSAKGV
jgi:hypothetical protein